jgi:hypothetical protein
VTYHVSDVDVLVTAQSGARVRSSSRDGRKVEHHETRRGVKLDAILNDLTQVAKRAFEYWLRVGRWTTDHSSLGQLRRDEREAQSTPELQSEDGSVLWRPIPVITIQIAGAAVSKREWNRWGAAVAAEEAPPVFIDFLHDANHRLYIGDRQGAVLAFAIACETAIRSVVLERNAPGMSQEGLKLLSSVPISRLLQRLNKVGPPAGFWTGLDRKTLQTLFDRRNALAHRGSEKDLTTAECRTFSVAATAMTVAAHRYLTSRRTSTS